MSEHHHRSTFSTSKKPFKGKSKGKLKRLNKGKVEARTSIKSSQVGLVRGQRLNRNKMLLQQKRQDVIAAKRLGKAGQPPKIVAVVALDDDVDLQAIRQIVQTNTKDSSMEGSHESAFCVLSEVDKNKQKILFFNTPRDPLALMDIAAAADVILLVASPGDCSEGVGLCVDDMGYHFTRLLKSQGYSCVMGAYQGLSRVPAKKHKDMKNLFSRFFETNFEDNPRVLPLETEADAKSLLRWIGNVKLKEPSIRTNRTYMLAEAVKFTANPDNPQLGTLEMAGFARGYNFNVNHLVHIAGYDDYQLAQIEELMDSRDIKSKKAMDNVSWNRQLTAMADPSKARDTTPLNPLDLLTNEQSIITEEEMRQAEEEGKAEQEKTKRKEKEQATGVSEYQQVWNEIVSSEDEDDEDEDDEKNATMGSKEEEEESKEDEGKTVRFADSVTMSETADPESRKKLERDEINHPDEVETPREGRASERFARYRGLKSFKHSVWDKLESLPVEFGHINDFEDFNITRNSIVQMDLESATAPAGNRMILHARNVSLAHFTEMTQSQRPVVVWSLFEHEQKVSICHFQIRRNPEYEEVVKGKDLMMFQVGFRRFCARPIYTQHNTNADKHMVERYFHQGRFSVASVYCRIQFPPSPVLMFLPPTGATPGRCPQIPSAATTLVANGSLLSVDPSRLLIKRIILTGYPAGTNKKAGIIRQMFWNPDDIRWFKPVEIWTKYGHVGHIKEPRGTKGYMKCIFSGFIKSNDTVCMSLYKRQFPVFDKADRKSVV